MEQKVNYMKVYVYLSFTFDEIKNSTFAITKKHKIFPEP